MKKLLPLVTAFSFLSILALPLEPTVAQGLREGGFYRQSSNPTVLYQYEGRRYCGVQNEPHLNVLGGSGRVEDAGYLQLNGRYAGACPWPNGYYRRADETTVYRLSGGARNGLFGDKICAVVSETQMYEFGGFNQVMVVPVNSDISAGRGKPRRCR
jgi:hypothetical protein